MKVRFVKPEVSNPERDRGIQVPYAPGKRNQARWRWYLILLVVSSPFLFFVGHFLYSTVVVQAPGFVAQEQLTVRASAPGYVDEVYVHTLDQVKEGDPVAKLANDGLAARAGQLQAELQQLQKVARTTNTGGGVTPAPLDAVDFAGELQTARDQKERLAGRLEQIQQLQAQGAATEAEVNSARGQYEQASSKLDELYRTMALQTQPTQHSGNAGILVQTQTRILQIQTELANLQAQQEALLVRAPKTGRVVDLAVVKGDQMAIGSKVAMLAPDGGEMHIDAYIPPKNGVYAAPGMRATVIFPDGSRREAVVADVPQIATEVPKAQSALLGASEMGVLVRMQLLDKSEVAQRPLTDGLPVKVEFEHRWDSPGATQFATQMQRYWEDLRSRLLTRRV